MGFYFMSKLRSVSTAFWSDPVVEELNNNEKLLFLYLITNDKTNMLGIFESTVKKMSFETGIKKDEVIKALKHFEKLKKIKYINNYVILINFMRHQNYNTNMKKSAIDTYNQLPNVFKDSKLTPSKDNPLEGFESLLNHYGMVSKVEVEYEEEIEVESKLEIKPNNDFYIFWESYHDITGKPKTDKKRTSELWDKLTIEEKANAKKNIKPFADLFSDPKYRKKARTYLADKNFNDEFQTKTNTKSVQQEYPGMKFNERGALIIPKNFVG